MRSVFKIRLTNADEELWQNEIVFLNESNLGYVTFSVPELQDICSPSRETVPVQYLLPNTDEPNRCVESSLKIHITWFGVSKVSAFRSPN